MTSITDLGNSINLRSSEVLSRMVAFGQIASGQDVSIPEAGNDVSLGSYNKFDIKNGGSDDDANYQMLRSDGKEYEFDLNTDGTKTYKQSTDPLKEYDVEKVQQAYDQFCASGQNLKGDASTTADMIAGCLVQVGDTVLAGGMVELQAKIDAMLSTVQMSIKNGGQVSQTLQAAARG